MLLVSAFAPCSFYEGLRTLSSVAIRFLFSSKEVVRKASLAVDLLVQILRTAGYCRVFCSANS
jgi:hypothetical protein